jgi:hypothetical protein
VAAVNAVVDIDRIPTPGGEAHHSLEVDADARVSPPERMRLSGSCWLEAFMSLPDRREKTPRTLGYDNNHVLIAILILCGVVGGVSYLYGAYFAPQPAVVTTHSSDGPAPQGIAKTPLASTSPVATAPSSTTPPSR